MTTAAKSTGYARRSEAGVSWWYTGCLVTPLARGVDTDGQLSIAECVVRRGLEPPPHVHAHEDEGFYVLEGALTVVVGEESFVAREGSFVWAPRGVLHTWEVHDETARFLVLTTPGGFPEAMFEPFSEPAAELVLPPVPDELPFEAMLELDRRLGVDYPAPEGAGAASGATSG